MLFNKLQNPTYIGRSHNALVVIVSCWQTINRVKCVYFRDDTEILLW
jgi:hypothetical protein